MGAFSFKRRFVAPIQAGLGILPVIDGHPAEFVIEGGKTRPFDSERDLDPPVRPKRQTIRAHRKDGRVCKPGETLALYCAMRTPQCFLIGRASCLRALPIMLDFSGLVAINRQAFQRARLLDKFAREDGFADFADMRAFWAEERGSARKFEGIITFWEPLP